MKFSKFFKQTTSNLRWPEVSIPQGETRNRAPSVSVMGDAFNCLSTKILKTPLYFQKIVFNTHYYGCVLKTFDLLIIKILQKEL